MHCVRFTVLTVLNIFWNVLISLIYLLLNSSVNEASFTGLPHSKEMREGLVKEASAKYCNLH